MYVTPADVGVSSNYPDHKNRKPPSREPGTDYATARNTDLRAPGNGRVLSVDHSNAGAEGRRITFLMDNGEVIDWIHLERILVGVGFRFTKGQRGIALSGGSANGSNSGVGWHVHVTRRQRQGLGYGQSVDFEAALDRRPGGSFPMRDMYGAAYVVSFQNFLLSLGFDIGQADGWDGERTQAAVRTLQQWTGLTVDGQFGKQCTELRGKIEAGGNFTSRDVAEIQRFLEGRGIGVGGADGRWGNKTSLGTYIYQRQVGLTADAQWGAATDKLAFPGKTYPTDGYNAIPNKRKTSDIQTFLKGQGLYDGKIDDDYGPGTSTGTARFQEKQGITVDGSWGDITDGKAVALGGFKPIPQPEPEPEPEPGPPATVGRNITTRKNSDIQQKLKDKGLYAGEIDAQYGAGTTAGVIAVQKAAGLEQDGVYGAKTDVVLFARPKTFKRSRGAVSVPHAGTKVANRKVSGVNVHHYGGVGDDRAYFAGPNGRNSCPTIANTALEGMWEYIPISLQPWSTGGADLDRIAIEFQNTTGDPEWKVGDAQREDFIELLVELRELNGSVVDGVLIDFPEITRQRVGLDRDFRQTACPGPCIASNIDAWIAEANRRYAERHPVEPPVDKVQVDRSYMENLEAELEAALAATREQLAG